MKIFNKHYLFIFSLIATITLAACGGGSSSTEDSSAEATVTTESGVTTTFETNEATVNEVIEFFYDLGGDEFTGTIRWGDNTETRVRGSGSARHIYRADGERAIAIQIDGGDNERVATINVVAAADEEDDEDVQAVAATFSSGADFDCTVASSGTIQSPTSGEIITINYTPNPNGLVSISQGCVFLDDNIVLCPYVMATLFFVTATIGLREISLGAPGGGQNDFLIFVQ